MRDSVQESPAKRHPRTFLGFEALLDIAEDFVQQYILIQYNYTNGPAIYTNLMKTLQKPPFSFSSFLLRAPRPFSPLPAPPAPIFRPRNALHTPQNTHFAIYTNLENLPAIYTSKYH